MPTFFEKLDCRAKKINSLLCIGLDPNLEDLTKRSAAEAEAFCTRIIKATSEYALAYKPNTAFFEALGPEGWEILQRVIRAIPDEIPVILDAKRGDISSAARAYAFSAFDVMKADAVTLNPYLGYDSITPFMQDPEKGVFLICKTSNPGSIDLQDLTLGGHYRLTTVYEKIAGLSTEWGTMNNLGLVVGATFPDALKRVRELAPYQWILAPGIGAKDGDLRAAMHAGLRKDGLGLLINVSQDICHNEDPHEAARQLVMRFRDAQQDTRPQSTGDKEEFSYLFAPVVEGLLSMGCIRFGEFKLKSGVVSPIYINLRRLVSFPGWMNQVAAAYIHVLRDLNFDRIAGLPLAALPITTAISLQGNWPMIYTRELPKDFGDLAPVEGVFYLGETAVLIDDIAITGSSELVTIEKLSDAGLKVNNVVVLIDRETGAKEVLAEAGYQLHSLFTMTSLLNYWDVTQRIPKEQITTARAFLQEFQG